MCMQCMAGAMTAAAGASGTRSWIVARFGHLLTPRRKRVLSIALIVAGVVVQGYLGGRDGLRPRHRRLRRGRVRPIGKRRQATRARPRAGMDEGAAGKQAFSAGGLGCATCHGDLAQGLRGPTLAGGRDIEEFRGVHGHGLFPPAIVSDRDFAAINAWLRTLPHPRGGGGSED
jgi:hypothetical protein